MSKNNKYGSEGNKASPLAKAAKFDPNSAIQDAQARFDAEDTETRWFRRPFLITALVSLIAAGGVISYYFIDRGMINRSIENCHSQLNNLNTSDQTIEECTIAAKEGDKKALVGLAGIYVAKDRKDIAYPYLRKCAEDNNSLCEYFLSSIYRDGINGLIQPDTDKFILWLGRAAEHGSVHANFSLYQIYINGDKNLGIKENPHYADEFLRNAAELGHAFSLYQMSENYRLEAPGYQSDYDKELDYLRRAADQGYPEAQGKYSLYLLENDKISEASSYLEKGAAAEDPLSSVLLAGLYRDGSVKSDDDPNVTKDKILNLYLKGAEVGNETAIEALIDIYHNEDDSYSYTHWLKIALERNMPIAFGKMGQAIEEEYVIEKPDMPSDNDGITIHEILKNNPTLEAAVQYYRRGIARHDNFSYRRLLEIYKQPEFKGKLNKSFFELAKDYAEVEPEYGLEYLAFCYVYGIGTSKNEAKAAELLAQRVANYADIPLALELIRQYFTGTGSRYDFKRDIKQAVHFADLMIEVNSEKGITEYLKFVEEIDNNKLIDKNQLSNFLLGLSEESKFKLKDNLEYQFDVLKASTNQRNIKAEALADMRSAADSLVDQGYTPAIMLYADMALTGKVMFKAPDIRKARDLYELVVQTEGDEVGDACGKLAEIYGLKLERKERDWAKSLQFAKEAVDRRYDPALKFILTNFVYDQSKDKKDMLHITEKFYYLKLAEMLQLLDRQGKFNLDKISKELNEQQLAQTDQMVFEEMAARRAAVVK